MDCADYIEWILRKLEGTLSPECERELDRHLASCRRCRAELLLQEKIQTALTEELPIGLAPDFARSVAEKAARDFARERRAERWANLIPIIAVAGVAVVVISLIGSFGGSAPSMIHSLTGAVEAPIHWVGDTILGLLATLADLPKERIPAMEQVSRPLLNIVGLVLLGTLPTLWGFYRIFAFLKH